MKAQQSLARMLSCLVLFLGPLHAEDSALIEPPWADAADGFVNKGEYIDLNVLEMDRVLFQHCPMTDSGVQIERVKGGETIWRRHVQRLGVFHSAYFHQVGVRIWRDVIYIESRGEKIIYETRKVSDGSLIMREIRDTNKPMINFLNIKEFGPIIERAKEDQQPGVVQPATKPPEKAPAKDQPTSPTPKDAPR